jgi:hypothetical protein
VAALSPSVRAPINRFGRYRLDLGRPPTAIDDDLPVVTAASPSEGPSPVPAGR